MRIRSFKRFLSFVLAAVLLLGMIPAVPAVAAEVASGFCGQTLRWSLDTAGVLTISGSGTMSSYENCLDPYSSPNRFAPWADYRLEINKIVVNKGVENVGHNAFSHCSNVTEVSLPNGLEGIGDNAFISCSSLSKINIPATVTSISSCAFDGCSSLKTVVLPESLTWVGNYAFGNCTGLESVVWPSGLTSIPYGMFAECTSLTTVALPAQLEEIGPNAFMGCSSLQEISIPAGVTTIDQGAFAGSGLKKVTVPAGITELAISVFRDCPNLEEVTLPNGLIKIKQSAFENCQKLEQITIPESVREIDLFAFIDCSNLTTVNLPENLTSLGWGAFAYTNLKEVTVPALITSLAEMVFCECDNLEKVVLTGGNLVSIGKDAFSGSEGLKEITIPGSVTSIEAGAFSYCNALERVTFEGDAPQIAADSFEGPGVTIRYPRTGKNWSTVINKEYQGNITWQPYCEDDNHVYSASVIAPTCTQKGYTSYTCVCGASYTDSEVPALGHSFGGDRICTVCGYSDVLDSGVCGDNVTWILGKDGKLTISGTGAMYDFGGIGVPWDAYCEQITSVTINKGVTYIGDFAFQYCGKLSRITIPSTVKKIGNRVFAFCTSLKEITLPSGITSIGHGLFYNCSALTKITIPQNVTVIGNEAFIGCSGLTAVTVPDKVTSIGDSAFMYCTAMEKITIPKTVSNIGLNAFYGCTGLKHVYYAGTPSQWKSVAIAANNQYLTSATIHYAQLDTPVVSKLESTASGIKLTWGKVAGAGKYRVFVKTSKGWAKLADTTSTSFVYTGAKPGLTYTFTVRCLNAAGTAFTSAYNTTGWRHTHCAAPAISKFESTASGIKLTWGKISGAGKYRVFVKTSNGWTKAGDTTGTSFVWTGAKTGVNYTFTVRCLSADGKSFTSAYNTAGWKGTYSPAPVISGFKSAANGLQISWKPINGAAKYRVFVKTSKGWAKVGDTTGTSLVWTGAKTGVSYTFTVRCLNAAGTAFTSSYNTTGWKGTYSPAPAVKLANTTKGIQISWGKINGAAKYRVFVKTSKGWATLGDTTGTSFVWTGAKAGQTYTFTVRCVNAAGTAYTSSYNTAGWSIKRSK